MMEEIKKGYYNHLVKKIIYEIEINNDYIGQDYEEVKKKLAHDLRILLNNKEDFECIVSFLEEENELVKRRIKK